MILYNTLVGVAAGAAMVLVPMLARMMARGESVAAEGWSICFGVLGAILAVFGGLIAVTWPLNAKPQVNIMFGEPTCFLGLLLLAAAMYLWRHAGDFRELDDDGWRALLRVAGPVSWLLFVLGLVLLSITIAIFRFTAVGVAPRAEPVAGQLANVPWLENSLIGLLYGLAAIGTLLAPWAVRNLGGGLARLAGTCLVVGGVALVLYSAVNYYTHIGLLMGR
ncbi:MAG: DUF981 family protein [Mycobacterium sp.]|nr:DUF981 family protein [Mycobacterium sp.]